MVSELLKLVTHLKLKGVGQVLQRELQRAEKEGLSHPELLHRLLLAEDQYRRERSLQWRTQQARLLWAWTLQSFPFEQQPGVNKVQIMTLAGLPRVPRGKGKKTSSSSAIPARAKPASP
jgi:hypothetical protein